MLTRFVSLSWPQHAHAYSGTLTNSSVPSKYSAFCNHFGTGHQGKSQREPKRQRRSSICCTARPDSKALSQKTYIFTHSVLAQRKAHSTVFQMHLSWCYQTQSFQSEGAVSAALHYKESPSICWFIGCQVDWGTCAPESLCLLFHRLRALCPLVRKPSSTLPAFQLGQGKW